ncbi:uncharacterized protein LOC144711940 isoform X2 [Wolffia australiana]
MEKRNSKQPRSTMQGTKQAISMGRNSSSSQLPHLLPRLGASEHGCGGCFTLARTPSVDDEETCLLLSKNSDFPSAPRMTFPSSPSPVGSAATSFPVSPSSDMFCSHGTTSDSFSPSSLETIPAPPEVGRRRGKETVTPRSLELEIRQMSLQELPMLQRSSASEQIQDSLSALRDAHAKLTAAMHKQAFCNSDRPSSDCVNEGSGSSEADTSEMESAINDHLRRAARRSRGVALVTASENEENEIEARLEQWAEARTVQLLRKLKTKEDEISEWENLKAAKARMQLREFEVKLEEKREKAMEKMQKSLLSAKRRAEKKKSKERASADKKVMEVVGALEKRGGSSRKMPCKLICL